MEPNSTGGWLCSPLSWDMLHWLHLDVGVHGSHGFRLRVNCTPSIPGAAACRWQMMHFLYNQVNQLLFGFRRVVNFKNKDCEFLQSSYNPHSYSPAMNILVRLFVTPNKPHSASPLTVTSCYYDVFVIVNKPHYQWQKPGTGERSHTQQLHLAKEVWKDPHQSFKWGERKRGTMTEH